MKDLKKILVCILCIGVTYITFASIGGGKNKAKNSLIKPAFTPVKTGKGFSMKGSLNYRGSLILKQERTPTHISYNSLVTFQKGNATYILPNRYKVSLASNTEKSNLQMLNLKIRLCK